MLIQDFASCASYSISNNSFIKHFYKSAVQTNFATANKNKKIMRIHTNKNTDKRYHSEVLPGTARYNNGYGNCDSGHYSFFVQGKKCS